MLRSLRPYLSPAGAQLLIPAPEDDAAVWRHGGTLYVGTVDTMVEDIDFRLRWPGFDFRVLGRRLLSINLSDLAAMGAQPQHALISLALPPRLPVRALHRLFRGISEQARRYGCSVAGGDLSATLGPLVATAAVFGTILSGRQPLTRRGARPGWLVAVTGTLGGAAAGLRLLESGRAARTAAERRWVRAQLDPTPRLEAAAVLQQAGIRVAGDISDGLYREVEKIAEAAMLGARIEVEQLPVDAGLRRAQAGRAWRLALKDSEDFELVCAAPAARVRAAAVELERQIGLRLTVVGQLARERGIRVRRGGREVFLKDAGYQHFR